MMSTKSYRPVLLAMTIMLLGLFMLCAQKQVIQTPGEDMTGGDEEFREELLEMLELAGEGEDTAMFAATTEEPAAVVEETPAVGASNEVEAEEGMSDDEAALMALLAGLEGEDASSDIVFEETPEQVAEPEPVVASTSTARSKNDYAYNELMSEVERLEMILEQRSMQADSLRRIIDNRSARIARLESDVAIASNAVPQYAAVEPEAEPVIVSTKTAKTYQPVHTQAGPFSQKYQQGRQQFESYNYQGCIETMTALLEENPNHSLADNAQYWIGESYYGLKQYQKAILEFQKVFAFDKPDKYDDAQLMIGLSYVRLDQNEMARSTFGEFLDTYTGSEYTGVAKRYYYNI